MNRHLTHLLGPEAALAVATALMFWFCARHNSGEGRDVAIMEKLIWMIPFLLTPIAFATILAPDAKNWWWLGRAILFTYIAIFVCGFRIIERIRLGFERSGCRDDSAGDAWRRWPAAIASSGSPAR
jgi:hypothetical protein